MSDSDAERSARKSAPAETPTLTPRPLSLPEGGRERGVGTLVHATTVDLAGLGVLIMGAPGAGKSELALRLIADGAFLVADDQTWVEAIEGVLRACAPARIAGLIEQRGVGIARAPTKKATRLRLALALSHRIERMPERRAWSLPGEAAPHVPLIDFDARETSAPAKLRFALTAVLST